MCSTCEPRRKEKKSFGEQLARTTYEQGRSQDTEKEEKVKV